MFRPNACTGIARLAPLALAVLPAAATGQESGSALVPTVQTVSQPRPGQYRTVLELLEFDAPGASGALASELRGVFAEELAAGNAFCLRPGAAEAARIRSMVGAVAEGACTFERFDMTGEAVSAALSCRHGAGIDGPVTVDGRVWPENSDLELTLTPAFESIGGTRIRVRARSARVGDC